MTAGAFCPPDLVTMRQNFPLRKQSFLADAAQAHSVSTVRSQGLPPVVALLLFFPALRLLPGHTPAHERSSFAERNCSMFAPLSGRIVAALRSWTPGSVCRSSHCCCKPASLIFLAMAVYFPKLLVHKLQMLYAV